MYYYDMCDNYVIDIRVCDRDKAVYTFWCVGRNNV